MNNKSQKETDHEQGKYKALSTLVISNAALKLIREVKAPPLIVVGSLIEEAQSILRCIETEEPEFRRFLTTVKNATADFILWQQQMAEAKKIADEIIPQ